MTKDEADALLHKFAIECRFGTQDSCASAAIPILTALMADPPNCGELEGTPAYEWGFSAGKAWEKARKAAIASEADDPPDFEPTPEMVKQGVWAWQRHERSTTADDVRAIYVAMRRMEQRHVQDLGNAWLHTANKQLRNELINAWAKRDKLKEALQAVAEAMDDDCISKAQRIARVALAASTKP